jgi:hypothetical protein
MTFEPSAPSIVFRTTSLTSLSDRFTSTTKFGINALEGEGEEAEGDGAGLADERWSGKLEVLI